MFLVLNYLYLQINLKTSEMKNRLLEIIKDFNRIKDKKNKTTTHIYDSTNKKHLFEIINSDNTVLVSREFVWDVLMNEFSKTDLEVQDILNDFTRKKFRLSNQYTCNRMIF